MNLKRIAAGLLLALTGATAPAIVTAAPAHADTVSAWEAVAQCESNGQWNLPYGTDSSTGGLQIQDATWGDYGGTAFAPHAYQTTEGTQILIAERIYASQGPSAWTTISDGCAPDPGGGTQASSGVVSNPPPAPAPMAPVTPILPAPIKGDYTVQSGDTLSSIASSHGVSLAALEQANSDIAPNSDVIFPGEQLILPAQPVAHVLPPPPITVVLADGKTVPGCSSGFVAPFTSTTHTVEAGDNLAIIANDHRTTPQAIVNLNGLTNGNNLTIGQVLLIPPEHTSTLPAGLIVCAPSVAPPTFPPLTPPVSPAPPTASPPPTAPPAAPAPPVVSGHHTYTVHSGDNLFDIAVDHGMGPSGWVQLWHMNQHTVGSNPNLIFPGQVLVLPGT
jgi:LysM repeat protein